MLHFNPACIYNVLQAHESHGELFKSGQSEFGSPSLIQYDYPEMQLLFLFANHTYARQKILDHTEKENLEQEALGCGTLFSFTS